MMLDSMNRLTLTPPEKYGVKIIVDYFRRVGLGRVPEENYRLRFMLSVPMTARLNRRVGGEAGLEVGRVSEGSLDVALNIVNYYVPPETDGREMVRAKSNFVSATAYDLHREFCRRYLAAMNQEGGQISDEEIMAFIESNSSSTEGPELVFDRSAQRAKGGEPEEPLDLRDAPDREELANEVFEDEGRQDGEEP